MIYMFVAGADFRASGGHWDRMTGEGEHDGEA